MRQGKPPHTYATYKMFLCTNGVHCKTILYGKVSYSNTRLALGNILLVPPHPSPPYLPRSPWPSRNNRANVAASFSYFSQISKHFYSNGTIVNSNIKKPSMQRKKMGKIASTIWEMNENMGCIPFFTIIYFFFDKIRSHILI